MAVVTDVAVRPEQPEGLDDSAVRFFARHFGRAVTALAWRAASNHPDGPTPMVDRYQCGSAGRGDGKAGGLGTGRSSRGVGRKRVDTLRARVITLVGWDASSTSCVLTVW
jgi:hypothetical protein